MNFLSRTKSALQPLLSEVSTRTAELRDFESAINAKKQELERVSKKLEEVSSTLRCESLVFFVINKSLFNFHHLYYQLLYFQRPGQQVNTYWWQLASSSRPACWCILIYFKYRNDIVLCSIHSIFCTLSQFSCRSKDCLSLPCPMSNMSHAGSLIFNLAAGSQLASSFLAEKVQNLSIPMFVICGIVLISYTVVNLCWDCLTLFHCSRKQLI